MDPCTVVLIACLVSVGCNSKLPDPSAVGSGHTAYLSEFMNVLCTSLWFDRALWPGWKWPSHSVKLRTVQLNCASCLASFRGDSIKSQPESKLRNWGAPERAPHSACLCAVKSLFVSFWSPMVYGGGGSFRVVEHRANVNVVSSSLTKTTSLFFSQKQLFFG